jgi:hypothetical protein
MTVLDKVTPKQAYLQDWTMAGDVLAAARGTGHTALWWRLDKHSSGSVHFPGRYVSAGRHGVLFMAKNGVLRNMAFGGKTTRVARPYTSRPHGLNAAADRHGVVIAGLGSATYVSFSHGHHVQALQTGTPHHVDCRAVSKLYAACTTTQGPYTGAALLALDGSAPILANDDRERVDGGVALSGPSRLIWDRFKGTSSSAGPDLTLASRDAVTAGQVDGTIPVAIAPNCITRLGWR